MPYLISDAFAYALAAGIGGFILGFFAAAWLFRDVSIPQDYSDDFVTYEDYMDLRRQMAESGIKWDSATRKRYGLDKPE